MTPPTDVFDKQVTWRINDVSVAQKGFADFFLGMKFKLQPVKHRNRVVCYEMEQFGGNSQPWNGTILLPRGNTAVTTDVLGSALFKLPRWKKDPGEPGKPAGAEKYAQVLKQFESDDFHAIEWGRLEGDFEVQIGSEPMVEQITIWGVDTAIVAEDGSITPLILLKVLPRLDEEQADSPAKRSMRLLAAALEGGIAHGDPE